MLSARECKAARTGMDWTRDDLAGKSQVGKRTIIDFENGAREPINATKQALRQALEAGGARFEPGRVSVPTDTDQGELPM